MRKRIMRNALAMACPSLAGVLAGMLAVPAFAVDFDQGVDAGAVLQQVRADAPKAVASVDGVQAAYNQSWPDCQTLAIGAGASDPSAAVWLHSRQDDGNCTPAGDPRHGGGVCIPGPGRSFNKWVSVKIEGRKPLLPWETETFQACLDGPWASVRAEDTAYKYKITDGASDGQFVAVPGARTPMAPDKDGIAAAGLAPAGAGLSIAFNDKWASYYGAGEKTVLHVELWKERALFDDKVVDEDLTFAPASVYQVSFGQARFETGRKYYVKWGFKRLGQVSSDKYVKKGETAKVVFAAPAGAAGR